MAHIRLALSQFRPTKGEYAENVARIGAVITQAASLDPKPDLVDYRVAEGIALLTLNDPPANTYSYDMMQQIDSRILEARLDER